VNPDRLAELEEERRFLLESIRDLEREHAAGDVDDHDHQVLRDGYVARAAIVLRAIEDGRSTLPPKPSRPWWQLPVIVGGTVLVAVLLGLFVARSAGQRLPGQTLTGGQPADEVAVKLAEARQLLNTDTTGALAAYADVLAIEPENVEARTYTAWLLVLNGAQAKSQQQVQQAISLLQDAAALDPTYADVRCLLAVANGRFLDPPDSSAAIAAGEACLAANPPRDMVPMVQQLIDSLR